MADTYKTGATIPEEVAFKLWLDMRKVTDSVDDQLRFFARCRRAVYGTGEFKTLASN